MTSRRLLDPISRTLLDAIDIIDRRGWCQHAAEDILGRVCPHKAIRLAGRTFDEKFGAEAKLRRYLGEDSIHGWNDREERTQAEVTAALRGAALYPP